MDVADGGKGEGRLFSCSSDGGKRGEERRERAAAAGGAGRQLLRGEGECGCGEAADGVGLGVWVGAGAGQRGLLAHPAPGLLLHAQRHRRPRLLRLRRLLLQAERGLRRLQFQWPRHHHTNQPKLWHLRLPFQCNNKLFDHRYTKLFFTLLSNAHRHIF